MAPSRLLLQQLLPPSVKAIRLLGAGTGTTTTRTRTARLLSYAGPRARGYNTKYQPEEEAPKPRAPRPKPRWRGIVMANVTKANFREACEQLLAHLQTADFVALDFEMTGVETAPWRRHSELDTCETRYQHIKNSAESFAVWQCGVCPFKWDESGQKFVAYPYNFYIFPRNELPVDMASKSYFCQTTSLEFLAKHHFDFNATVYSGISYLSLEQEQVARAKLGLTEEAQGRKRRLVESESEIPLTRTADVVFSERVRVQLGQWRDGLMRNKLQWQGTMKGVGGGIGAGGGGSGGSTGSSGSGSGGLTLQSTQANPVGPLGADVSGSEVDSKAPLGSGEVPPSLRPSYYVDILGNNQARLVKQVLRKHYPDLVPVVIAKPNNDERQQVRIIFTSSSEDKAKLQEELELEEFRGLEALLSDAVGFRKIIDAIKAAGKPLVGHNCLLDLAHLHDKFVGPLPSSAKAFSASILHHFPCVLDTKYLLKTEPTLRDVNMNKVTSLAIVYQELCHGFSDKSSVPGRFYVGKPKLLGRPMSRVKLEISSELQRYSGGLDTGLKHEAGFDAYMTGAVFAQICHVLRVDAATIRQLAPVAAAGGELLTGFASYANLMMLQTFRGQAALDLSTGTEAVGLKAPRGPTMPPFRLAERDNVALVWGPLPALGLEGFVRRVVQDVFTKDKRQASIDVYPVDGSSAFVEFRTPAILESFFKAIAVTVTAVRKGPVASVSGSDGAEVEFPLRAARFEAYDRICRSPLGTQLLGTAADLLGINQVGAETVARTSYSPRSPVAETLSEQGTVNLSGEGETAVEGAVAAFEVGEWGQGVAPPSEDEGSGQRDRQGVSEANPGCAPSGLPRGSEAEASNTGDSSKGKGGLAVESSYGKWMKHGSGEEPSDTRDPKRRRSGLVTDDVGESNL